MPFLVRGSVHAWPFPEQLDGLRRAMPDADPAVVDDLSLAALVAQMPESTFVMVDPNCRPTATPDFERYQARMRRIIARADVVKGSDEDFEYLALAETPEATARLLLEQGVGAVLVTHGAIDPFSSFGSSSLSYLLAYAVGADLDR